MRGRIVLVERGDCYFIDKVRRVNDAGAIGAIILVLAATGLWALSGFGPGAEREIIDLAKRAFSRFRNRRSKDTEEVISS